MRERDGESSAGEDPSSATCFPEPEGAKVPHTAKLFASLLTGSPTAESRGGGLVRLRDTWKRCEWDAYAAPLAGVRTGILSAASTSLSAGGSGASGPPGTGVIHTCIMGWVTLLTLPAPHDELASLPTTVPPSVLKQRSVWRCHWVRHPPGCGGVCPFGTRYIAADSTAPCAVFT